MRFFLIISSVFILSGALSGADERPNILWITSEDNGPYLGCYGDGLARTPHLDGLAKESTRYRNCFSNAAVCAPARQTLISGMYATSIGGQHMRSSATFPEGVSFFPKYLRDAGYYTTNNSKTDYNGGPRDSGAAMKAAWNESSRKAHWRNRPDPTTPFFSVFNITDSHESNLFPNRWKNRELKTDPESVNLPAHLPDLPEIRLDLARYYDCLEEMDKKAGAILRELQKDGLAENTIVFYFADHGGSMPRGKSFTYDSGTQVPLLIRTPETWKTFREGAPGEVSDRLVSFVDFAPTLLSLVDTDIPEHMQGQAFLGPAAAAPRPFVHTFRGRRGERYDIVRGVRGDEFLYLRNYTPHLPVMQFNAYSFGIPGYGAWKAAVESGRCAKEQSQWFQPKPSEELYRVTDDPDNVKNLADDPAFSTVLEKYRAGNDRHIREIRDSVFFPEGMEGREFAAYQDDLRYPLDQLIELGSAVSDRDPAHLELFRDALKSENPCLRYWGVMGCLVLEEEATDAKQDLIERLEDSSPLIQIQAARALAGMGAKSEALPTIRHFTESAKTQELALRAVLAIDECDLLETDPGLRELLKKAKGSYTQRVVDKLLSGASNP
ncbi:MAG: sulfatase-like hydrolase/transferase [Verrucomicrobiales bacterium]|nr:sulfatase-like hydrolase/transferase [Verrucomicrobiales bacterium]